MADEKVTKAPEAQPIFYNVMPEVTSSKAGRPITKVNAAKSDTVFKATENRPDKITMGAKQNWLSKLPGHNFIWIAIGILVLLGIGLGVFFFLKNRTATPPPVAEDTTNTNTEPEPTPEVTTPADWLTKYFGSDTCTVITTCGDASDPDHDGLSNLDEFNTGTDPNNADSDHDGIADGDEKNIFGSDPLLSKTFRDSQYLDADFVKGGYDIKTNTPYTPEQLTQIKANVKEKGLHQPTLTTIGPISFDLYDFKDPNADALSNLNIDLSPQAKLDRDSQRQTTVKKIGAALLKYKEAKKTFPIVTDFVALSDTISTYNSVATNYNDPINKEQYVYAYDPGPKGEDFTLTYYSETQNQLIKYTAKNATDDVAKDAGAAGDQKRISDLESIKSALMIYSQSNVDSNSAQTNVFPTKEQYPSTLIPRYLSQMPKDPAGTDYTYDVTSNYASFTLKATLQSPPTGKTGYSCNETECVYY